MTLYIPERQRAELIRLLDTADNTLDHFVEAQTVKSVRRAIDQRAATLQTTLARIFRRQGNALVRILPRLNKYFTEDLSSDIDKLFDSAVLDTSSDMQEAIQKAVEAAVLAGGKSLVADFNASIVFSLTNPRAIAYTQQYAAKLITGIDNTSRDHIRQLVEIAVSNGTSYAQLAQQIKTAYKQYAVGTPQTYLRSRAELIAVTEIGNAYSAGNLQAAQTIAADGIPLEKLWQTVGDRRVSAGCRNNSNAGWIALDQDFPSGVDRPLRFPGCRCVALYRRKK